MRHGVGAGVGPGLGHLPAGLAAAAGGATVPYLELGVDGVGWGGVGWGGVGWGGVGWGGVGWGEVGWGGVGGVDGVEVVGWVGAATVLGTKGKAARTPPGKQSVQSSSLGCGSKN